MRELPANYEQIVREGVEALGWLESVIERRIEHSGETASRLLALRDVTGLAGRLAGAEPFVWREGLIRNILSLQDVGVLENWEKEAPHIIHSREDPEPAASSPHPARIRALRHFLELYLT